MPDLRLVRLVGLRLCHDIGGVAGTIGNALEMLDSVGSEAATLANDASDVLRRRLTLWRALLGGQGDMTLDALLGLLGGQLSGGRAQADAGTLDPATRIEEEMVPVLLSAMLLGGEALPRGGHVRLAGEPGREWAIWPEGPRAAWPAALLRAITGGALPEDPSGRDVLVVWLAALAGAAGLRLALAVPPNEGAGPLLLSASR
ncbi:histidine phosphotransferase family protein [Roseomonas rubea]|uniref:histidine phosphotransferase family protein n=1 Tax=Neoroseomonas rubea TaxID=2748666 RepID=UPI0018DFC8E2|nr:histidine phosphotransferase family protein [Roseomonas rubea]